jgi:hypothetical protein
MKRIATTLAVTIIELTASAETFVGVTSATNRLLVATNEAIFIHKFVGAFGAADFQVVKDGSVFTLQVPASNEWEFTPTPSSPAVIGGPCEIILTNQALVNFRRLVVTNVQTILLAPSVPPLTNTVMIAANQTLRVFRHFPALGAVNAQAKRGSSVATFTRISVHGNDEFSGPLELSFSGPSSGTQAYLLSYVLTEEAQVAPQGAALQSPTGGFYISVERSSNLTNWTPSVIQTLTEDQKAFYRLRITK